MRSKFGVIAALSKPEASALAIEIEQWLHDHACDVVLEAQLTEHARDQVDAIIVLGGDGLMMRVANAYPDVPLLGINFGKVGFLAMVERRDWLEALSALISRTYTIEEGSTLAASVVRGSTELDMGWAINDVVIRSGNRMVDIELYIDGHFVNTYPGDGMIVATPRGSTAYCMAAGGPILTAGVRGFALVPISCHSPIRTPMVASESVLIELLVSNRHEADLILDGRTVTQLEFNDVIQVRRGVHAFRLISLGKTNFYDAFRTKFNFQIRPDAVPSRRSALTSAQTSTSVTTSD